MRILVALALLLPATVPAQHRSGGSGVVQPQGALGGIYAGQGMSRPLGGIAPPGISSTPVRTTRTGGPRYVTPIYYVPNAFGTTFASEADASHYDSNYHPVALPPPPPRTGAIQFADSAPVPQPQTVIINHYYGKEEAKAAPASGGNDTASSDYYLIAYKNRNVIAAQAYWVDGETLHYVTTANVHNQSSLGLIDLDMTKRLNADREVPFSIPNN